MAEYDADVPAGIVMTSMEAIVGWLRKTSFWPLTMGLACCAIEMISYGGPRADAARWGHEVFRASPRQADLMIVSGRVSQKMAPVVRQLYDQMPEPKWVISMGACASSGGIFNNYAVSRDATISSRWMSTCQAARPARTCSLTPSSRSVSRSSIGHSWATCPRSRQPRRRRPSTPRPLSSRRGSCDE